MEDAALVRRGQPGAELPGDLDRLAPGRAADAAQERAEVLAVHVLHRDEVLAVGLADVVDAADVRVETCRATRTSSAEARARVRVLGEVLAAGT